MPRTLRRQRRGCDIGRGAWLRGVAGGWPENAGREKFCQRECPFSSSRFLPEWAAQIGKQLMDSF
jgi:hypothetical protein